MHDSALVDPIQAPTGTPIGSKKSNIAPTLAMVTFLGLGLTMIVFFWDLIVYEDAKHSHLLITPISAEASGTSERAASWNSLTQAEAKLGNQVPFSEVWQFPAKITLDDLSVIDLLAIEPEVSSAIGLESMQDNVLYMQTGSALTASLSVPRVKAAKDSPDFEADGQFLVDLKRVNVLADTQELEWILPTENPRAFVTEDTFFELVGAAMGLTNEEFSTWQTSPEGVQHQLSRKCLAKLIHFDDLRAAKRNLESEGFEVTSW